MGVSTTCGGYKLNPPINDAHLIEVTVPRSVSTNMTLGCVKLFYLTATSMFIIIPYFI
jgi:hypothetical protein